jgi:hypothetical protein
MSAAATGHSIKYKVVDPTPKDLGQLVPGIRTAQKYREAASKGGFGQTGIIYGSNTNLGTKWWIAGEDFRGRVITFPLNNRDPKGTRYMPQFRINCLFRRDNNQP